MSGEAAKYAALVRSLSEMGRVAVAFSGGVDSTLLLAAAVEALGRASVVAACGVSPTLPRSEWALARSLALQLGVPLVEVRTGEMDDPEFRSNPPQRCYHCKKHLLGAVTALARERGLARVVEGSNADDVADYRPGLRAVAESGVGSPLREVGLTKEEIRCLLREKGIPGWDRPPQACLASRIPYGLEIVPAKLARVERSEAALRALGFRCVRVRDWGHLAVVEVGPEDLDRLFEERMRTQATDRLRDAGYRAVALDVHGYRGGSLNDGLSG